MPGREALGLQGRRAATAALLVLIAALLAAVAALGSPGSPSSPQLRGGGQPASHGPKRKFGRGTSTNWSGYAVPGTGATKVSGTWTQPSVTCSPRENSWSSPWVGIDGDNSNTVEQIGTDSDCQNGTPVYYAWYEMYPKSLVTLGMAVHPGDSFTGTVTTTGSGAFILTLTNNATHASFQTTQNSKRARRSSVEWIMEGPYNGLLSKFGSVPFSAASASISGKSNASLGSYSNADPITMVNSQGVTRAVPSSVSGGTSFSVAWKHQ